MPRRDLVAAFGLFVAFLAIYAVTLCPGVYVEGSGELIGATWWPGTPHPTGYPLYVLLGRVTAWVLPLGSPAAAVNAATAVFGAAAAALFFLLLRRHGCVPAAAAGAAGLLALGRTVWSQAVIAEVYTLFLLGCVLVLWTSARPGSGACRRRRLWIAGYTAGLAATCHLQAVLLLPPALARVLWPYPGQSRRAGLGNLLRVAAGGLLGASVLLYLWVRNGLGPGFHWGPLDGPLALWDHVTGALYRPAFVPLPPKALAAAAARFGAQLAGEWAVPLLPVLGLGAVVAWRRARPLAATVGVAAALNVAAALVYHRDPAGLDVFFLLAILAACVAAAFGLDALWRALRLRFRWSETTVSACVAIAAALSVAGNAADASRANATLPDRFGRAVLADLPPEAVLLTDGDDASYIVDYLHRVEGVRPDVEVYNRIGRGRDLAADVDAEGRAWERLRREVQLLRSGRPVHLLVARALPDPAFRTVPAGLTYRVVGPGASAPAAPGPVTDLLAEGDETHPDPWLRKLAAVIWFMEGERRWALGLDGADAAWRHAADIVPGSRSTNYNVAVMLMRDNQLEDALEYAMRAVAADPVRVEGYELAANLLRRLGRLGAAEDLHKEAQDWARIP